MSVYRTDKQDCRDLRVWFNGQEIKRDCYYADTRRGVIRIFSRGPDETLVVEAGEVVKRELRGKVVVRGKVGRKR